jgi:hypothetical protein
MVAAHARHAQLVLRCAGVGADCRPLMSLGPCSFLLQNYYAQQWVDNVAIHLRVSDARLWWDHVGSLDLPTRYGVKTLEPKQEVWGLVACVTDPSGALW